MSNTKRTAEEKLAEMMEKLQRLELELAEKEIQITELATKGKRKRTKNEYATVAALENYHDNNSEDKNGDGLPARSFKQVFKFLAEYHPTGLLKYKHHAPIPQNEIINAFIEDMATFAKWDILAVDITADDSVDITADDSDSEDGEE